MDSTTRGAGRVKDGRGEFPSDKAIIDTVEQIAKQKGVSMAEVALAWSLGSQWVTAPIVGIRSTERLDELLKGLELKLSEEERGQIDEHYQPLKVRGHT
jgi:aryl-alcohol dehydrogenase-like predicted oxidoreductase